MASSTTPATIVGRAKGRSMTESRKLLADEVLSHEDPRDRHAHHGVDRRHAEREPEREPDGAASPRRGDGAPECSVAERDPPPPERRSGVVGRDRHREAVTDERRHRQQHDDREVADDERRATSRDERSPQSRANSAPWSCWRNVDSLVRWCSRGHARPWSRSRSRRRTAPTPSTSRQGSRSCPISRACRRRC